MITMPFDTPIWIGSPTDVRTDAQAVTALGNVNDLEFSTPTGIMRVSRERWKKAHLIELANASNDKIEL
jgi:hypothetical protein